MKSDEYRDPILAELSDDELLDALELLDKIKNNQHHARELSDREVFIIIKDCFLLILCCFLACSFSLVGFFS